jgi:hypothetical protein
MTLYLNEESSWTPEDEVYVRGIPSKYDELFELAEEKEGISVEGEENGLIQSMIDGRTYGLLETREDPFKEYILDFGTYSREEMILENVNFLEQRHVEPRAKIVKTGEERFETLLQIRSRMMEDRWNSKVIDMEDIQIERYMPIH